MALVLCSVAGPARAEAKNVDIYLGQGCFWHVQNELVNAEVKLLGRKGADVTALVGYAGGTEIGPKGEVCYHNRYSAPDYGQMGHTEVVGMSVPEDKVGEISKGLLDYAASSMFGRHDPQDRGGEYRSAIGLPGGMSGPAFQQIKDVAGGKLEFVAGKGNDGDTVGTKKVWVYDSDKFPFYQGEVYHQFHDDMLDRYPEEYHMLREVKFGAGSLKKVMCPDMKIKS
jgi:peptide methionine sulfoxide reductase MsrA